MARLHLTNPMHARPRRGFTLLEMVLVLGVAMLISAAAVWSLGSLRSGNALHEAVSGYESLLRQARVHAMREARPLRLHLSPATAPAMFVESDPAGQPGQFDQAVTPWAPLPPEGDVQLTRVNLRSSEELAAPALDAPASPDAADPVVTFQPDGTSDSIELELQSGDDETATAVIQLDGFTGAIAVVWGPQPQEAQATP
jgi:type II secretion system protein H